MFLLDELKQRRIFGEKKDAHESHRQFENE
jgi:hypothetical protein